MTDQSKLDQLITETWDEKLHASTVAIGSDDEADYLAEQLAKHVRDIGCSKAEAATFECPCERSTVVACTACGAPLAIAADQDDPCEHFIPMMRMLSEIAAERRAAVKPAVDKYLDAASKDAIELDSVGIAAQQAVELVAHRRTTSCPGKRISKRACPCDSTTLIACSTCGEVLYVALKPGEPCRHMLDWTAGMARS